MRGGMIPLVRDGDPVGDLDDENRFRAAVNNLLGMQGDGVTAVVRWFGGMPFISALTSNGERTFYTTGIISAATDTGTTVVNFALTQGSGTARPCLRDPATLKLTPDQNAQDLTIYNNVEAAIPSGYLVVCNWVDSCWVVVLAYKC